VLDRQWVEREMNEARLARREAEAAQAEVEALLRELQAIPPGHQRVVVSIAGFEQDAG
jgi:hypothetical protein